MALLRKLGWKEEPFEIGETIEYCGINAIVVHNNGNNGTVQVGEDLISWRWSAFGSDCTRTITPDKVGDHIKIKRQLSQNED